MPPYCLREFGIAFHQVYLAVGLTCGHFNLLPAHQCSVGGKQFHIKDPARGSAMVFGLHHVCLEPDCLSLVIAGVVKLEIYLFLLVEIIELMIVAGITHESPLGNGTTSDSANLGHGLYGCQGQCDE